MTNKQSHNLENLRKPAFASMETLILNTFQEAPLFKHVLRILLIIREAGGRGLVVGGCVRDALIGIPSHDFDVEIYGVSAQTLVDALSPHFKLDAVGNSFGVLKIHGLDIDLALPRRETKLGQGHKAFNVETVPDLSFREATARRDLTINAIMFDPLSGELIDPWNGAEDLKRHIIRRVSEHFAEDPLRVLRIMQFAARLDFDVAPETVKLCATMTPENLPRERLGAEWEKLLLQGVKPSRGLTFLKDCGWIRYFPELERLIGCQQAPEWHPEGDVWNHTLLALDVVPEKRNYDRFDNLVLALAVLCHDFGKPATTKRYPDGFLRSKGHDLAGIEPTLSFLHRLWLNNDLDKLVPQLVACHMRAHEMVRCNSDRAYRKLAVDAGRLDLLADVFECDMRASNHDDLEPVGIFRENAQRLAIAKEAPKPLILGRHLIQRGLKPGPVFTTILKHCFEKQIDGDFNTPEEALDFLDEYLHSLP